MTNFVETRETSTGTQSILSGVTIMYPRVSTPVPSYNGGKPEFNLSISLTNADQIAAFKEILPNMNVKEEGPTTFTLKRPAFLGSPGVVKANGDIIEPAARVTIGNGSVADIKISHKKHPKTGRPYVCLEALKIIKMKKFVPENTTLANDFDF